MASPWLTLLAFACGAPWWIPLARALLRDVRTAAESPDVAELQATEPPRAADGSSRVPLNRVLAFRARTRRSRWQAGFGRRGL